MMLITVLLAMTASSALLSRSPRARRPSAPQLATTHRERARRVVRVRGHRLLWAACALVVGVTLGPLLAAALVGGAATWPRINRALASRSRQRAIDAAWPDAVEMLILLVQAGLTPHQTVRLLANLAPLPTRNGFAEVCRRIERGAGLADAVSGLVAELGTAATGVADTLAMAERYGTPIAVALDQLAVDVRERRRRHAEEAARQLPIRMSFPLVTCTLPSFVLVAIVPAVLASLSSLTDGSL